MISQSEFKLDDKRREILPSYSEEFPFSCLKVSIDCFTGRTLHWHPALEIDYVTENILEYRFTGCGSVVLKKGDAIFINSNVMHSAKSVKKGKSADIYAFLFGREFLSGIFGGLLDQKYILPLHRNPELPFLVLHPTTPDTIRIIGLLLQLPPLARSEEYGYEFEIRNILCKIWLLLLKEAEKAPHGKAGKKLSEDSERLKKMILYIKEHYMEKINLDRIAAAAGLSGRECNRCFQRNLHMTPILYLNHYRVHIAAQMLLHTNESIFVISDLCGFHSSSYFGHVFKEVTGKTPLAYRKAGYGA